MVDYSDQDILNALTPVDASASPHTDDQVIGALPSQPVPATSTYGDAAPPPQQTGFFQNAAKAAQGMAGNINASLQGTSPVISDIKGNYLRQKLGVIGEDDSGKTVVMGTNGKEFDPNTMVALTDPSTGKTTAFARNPDTDEIGASSLARLASFGMMASPVAQGASVAAQAGEAPTVASRLAEFKNAGVNPTLADITQSKPVQTMQNFLSNVPIASNITKSAANTQLGQLASRADQVASTFGTATNPEQAGMALQSGIDNHVQRFLAQSGENFAKVPIPDDISAVLDNTKDALQGISSQITSNPELAQLVQNPKFKTYLDALDNGQGLSYADARKFRTFVGPYTQSGQLVSDTPIAQWKQLYGALSNDLTETANGVSHEAGAAAQAANDFHRQGMQNIEDNLQSLSNAASAEKAYNQLIGAAQNGGRADMAKVRAVQSSLTPEEFGNVASTYIRQMGTPSKGGATFSPTTYVSNYSKLSDDAKDALFGIPGTATRSQADSLHSVSQFMKNTEATANHSNTTSHLLAGALIGGEALNPEIIKSAAMGIGLGTPTALALTSPRVASFAANQAAPLGSAISRGVLTNNQFPKNVLFGPVPVSGN